jgi:hypothetical protein
VVVVLTTTWAAAAAVVVVLVRAALLVLVRIGVLRMVVMGQRGALRRMGRQQRRM